MTLLSAQVRMLIEQSTFAIEKWLFDVVWWYLASCSHFGVNFWLSLWLNLEKMWWVWGRKECYKFTLTSSRKNSPQNFCFRLKLWNLHRSNLLIYLQTGQFLYRFLKIGFDSVVQEVRSVAEPTFQMQKAWVPQHPRADSLL